MEKSEQLSVIYRHIGETLNISNTERNQIIVSYKAVGEYLGNLEEELDINIYPQGSLALGTIIKPLKSDRNGEYDVDMVCLLKNGTNLLPRQIKDIVGNRLKESERYRSMLDAEGKRCWTLLYSDFHMDILPSVPMNGEKNNHNIRLTHTEDYSNYNSKYSNPKGYLEWFQNKMKTSVVKSREIFAKKNDVEIDEIPLYNLRTPLQISIQLLKRHRDIMFQNSKENEHKPISIIVTTLATQAYEDKNLNLYDTLLLILNNMETHILINDEGKYIIENPTNPKENFADRWNEEPVKKVMFYNWLKKAKEDIIENPLAISGGIHKLKEPLSAVFGEKTIDKSFQSYAEEHRKKREEGKLGIDKDGKIIEKADKMVSKMTDHTFYGERDF